MWWNWSLDNDGSMMGRTPLCSEPLRCAYSCPLFINFNLTSGLVRWARGGDQISLPFFPMATLTKSPFSAFYYKFDCFNWLLEKRWLNLNFWNTDYNPKFGNMVKHSNKNFLNKQATRLASCLAKRRKQKCQNNLSLFFSVTHACIYPTNTSWVYRVSC